jgi:hypothetical protein
MSYAEPLITIALIALARQGRWRLFDRPLLAIL